MIVIGDAPLGRDWVLACAPCSSAGPAAASAAPQRRTLRRSISRSSAPQHQDALAQDDAVNERVFKEMENHGHATALHFLYYNFVRIHQTLRTSPAMAAGVTKRLWEMLDVVDVLEAWEKANA